MTKILYLETKLRELMGFNNLENGIKFSKIDNKVDIRKILKFCRKNKDKYFCYELKDDIIFELNFCTRPGMFSIKGFYVWKKINPNIRCFSEYLAEYWTIIKALKIALRDCISLYMFDKYSDREKWIDHLRYEIEEKQKFFFKYSDIDINIVYEMYIKQINTGHRIYIGNRWRNKL